MAAKRNGKSGTNIGRKIGLIGFELVDAEPEETENSDTDRDRNEMGESASKGGPERSVLTALTVGKRIQRACMKGERGGEQKDREDEIQNEMHIAGNRDEEPGDQEAEEDGVGEKLDEPETTVAEAVRECAADGF